MGTRRQRLHMTVGGGFLSVAEKTSEMRLRFFFSSMVLRVECRQGPYQGSASSALFILFWDKMSLTCPGCPLTLSPLDSSSRNCRHVAGHLAMTGFLLLNNLRPGAVAQRQSTCLPWAMPVTQQEKNKTITPPHERMKERREEKFQFNAICTTGKREKPQFV